MKTKIIAASLLSAVALSGCVTTGQGSYAQPQPYYAQPASYARPATVESVQQVAGSDNAVGGAVLGAVVGGILGNQIGRGSGRTIATLGGAAAGGYLGHEMGKGNGQPSSLMVSVRLDTGERFSFPETLDAPVRPGQRVYVRQQPDGAWRVVR